MADIIKFPSDTVPKLKPTTGGIIGSFIKAMGATTDPVQIRNDILHRQGKLLERWANESVEHLGTAAVLEMVESMALHLRKDIR